MVVSPGVPKPILASNGQKLPGSLSEKVWVLIKGVPQGMFIRAKDVTKPVLLFLHGGPAMPEFAISEGYPSVLEDQFVVCWWEQRGSGISYQPSASPEVLTESQLMEDAIAVTNYLRERFKQEKIYLMAHSAGTYFGIMVAAKAPQLFHAYVGVGQISRQMESEKLAYAYMIGEFVKRGNRRMEAKLKSVPLLSMSTMSKEYYAVRDKAMHRLGIGTTRSMRAVVLGIFWPVMLCRAYTLEEKVNLWKGKLSAPSTAMWNEILATDLTAVVRKLEVPVYFMSGLFDYTVSRTLAKSYFDLLEAPIKGFYTFTNSAHSPMFEEPTKFAEILRCDVVNGIVSLADSPHH